MLEERYIRRASLVRVIDGDTVVLDIDLGFGIWRKGQTARILGVNCPEMRGPAAVREAGNAAKMFTMTWFYGPDVTVRTEIRDTDAFGRVLVEVWQGDRSLAADLLAAGHAVAFKG
jgi:micrococcal nuclease